MGKYSTVNVASLSNVVKNSLNGLSSNSFEGVLTDLSSSSFKGNASKNLYEQLKRISTDTNLSGSVASIKKNLEVLQSALTLIKQYQDLESKIANLEPYLYTVDEDGKQVIDTNVQTNINGLRAQMSSLETQIDGVLV